MTEQLPADWAIQVVLDRPKFNRDRSNGAAWTLTTTKRDYAQGYGWAVTVVEFARMIEKYEPHLAPVDLDVLAVRKILAAIAEANGSLSSAISWSSGALDDKAVFLAALAAYRQGKSS